MHDVFHSFVPDFDWERFEGWIGQLSTTRDPGLLLRAPLCTAAPESYPPVKQVCVVGEELMTPVAKAADAADSKGKGEVSGEDVRCDPVTPLNPLSVSSIWKFTEDDLVDPTVPTCFGQWTKPVVEAEAKVPIVGPGGKRVQEGKKVTVLSTKLSNKATTDKKSVDAGSKKKFTDPREWTEPKKWDQESDSDFSARLVQWRKKRATVAKRLGVKLT